MPSAVNRGILQGPLLETCVALCTCCTPILHEQQDTSTLASTCGKCRLIMLEVVGSDQICAPPCCRASQVDSPDASGNGQRPSIKNEEENG